MVVRGVSSPPRRHALSAILFFMKHILTKEEALRLSPSLRTLETSIKENQYSNLGYTPREDGTFFVYELDWDYVHRYLAPRAAKNRSKSTKIGPFRVRISKHK